ncbi:NADH-ubiquinone oxidoreductase [Neofusicoccum parvum]|nr:NADH-ubiquinone oxidoreductase [Neofusicoccum parvum]
MPAIAAIAADLTTTARTPSARIAPRNPPVSPAPHVCSPPAAMSTPRFWSQPFRYMRWASHEKPAIFYSILVGLAGPATIVVVPPIRRLLGDQVGRPAIPLTYPIPKGPRQIPEGYDD